MQVIKIGFCKLYIICSSAKNVFLIPNKKCSVFVIKAILMNSVLWKDHRRQRRRVWNEGENPRNGLTERQDGISVWWEMGKKETDTDRKEDHQRHKMNKNEIINDK